MKRFLAIGMTMLMVLGLAACGKAKPADSVEAFLSALKEQDAAGVAEVYEGGGLNLMEMAIEISEVDEDNPESKMEAEPKADAEAAESKLMKVYDEELLPMLTDFDYEIVDENVDGNKATIKVKVSAYPLGDVFKDYYNSYLMWAAGKSTEELTGADLDKVAADMLSDKLYECEKKSYVNNVTFTLVKKNDKWVVRDFVPDGEIVDALTGGLAQATKSIKDYLGE